MVILFYYHMYITMDNLYIYVSSNKNLKRYPNNNSKQFTIPLNKPLFLKGRWSLGLVSLYIRSKSKVNKDLFVCYSIVRPSQINDVSRRVLRLVSRINTNRHKDFPVVQYIPIDNTGVIESIGISILDDETLDLSSLSLDSLNCTLHLKQDNPELLL
jgi:hypothetical protein